MAHLVLMLGTIWIFNFNIIFYFVSTTRNILTIVKLNIRDFNLISSNHQKYMCLLARLLAQHSIKIFTKKMEK